MRKELKMPSDKVLRSRGYMTNKEFLARLNFAMTEYMDKNCSSDLDGLHHPEDLAATALTCVETIFFGIQHFGVGDTND